MVGASLVWVLSCVSHDLPNDRFIYFPRLAGMARPAPLRVEFVGMPRGVTNTFVPQRRGGAEVFLVSSSQRLRVSAGESSREFLFQPRAALNKAGFSFLTRRHKDTKISFIQRFPRRRNGQTWAVRALRGDWGLLGCFRGFGGVLASDFSIPRSDLAFPRSDFRNPRSDLPIPGAVIAVS